MKSIKILFNPYVLGSFLLGIFFLSLASVSIAQNKLEEPVRVKVVKIVDGDTTTIEKTIEEASVQDFTKQFQNIKGKNVQVMITVENDSKDKKPGQSLSRKNKSASSMHFNFDMDSTMANSFSKMFMFSDSAMKGNFVWNDSLMKNFPKDFDFDFDFEGEEGMSNFDFNIDTEEDGKKIIIKKNGGKTIIINGENENQDEENISISKSDGTTTHSESDDGKTKTRTETIVINDDKTKSKKKVIVSTSVTVIDISEKNDRSADKRKKSDTEEKSFNFYPNPSDGNFILELELNGKENASVRITDMNGKEVYNETIIGNGKINKAISMGSDKKGTFIVILKQGKRTISKKIIIE